jgi:hypothetical protein
LARISKRWCQPRETPVQSGRESLQQHPKSPDGATAGTDPVAAGNEAATPTLQPKSTLNVDAVTQGSFVTFDHSRKYLARIIAVKGEKVTVRRFDKKTGEWRTKNETREREACTPLSAEEAEESFPGCVAAWDKAAQSPTGSGGKVSRHLSPNLPALVVAAPAFQSVADLMSAYDNKKKTIDNLASKFVDRAGEAKKAQDDILPHLADMQSLLSKKGTNHHLVIAARKQGHKIPWWTEYYESYKDKLWESLRTMERRIAAYRRDPTAPAPNPDLDPVPHFNKAARKALIEGNHCAVKVVAALEAGRDAKEEIADFKAVMNAKRLDDILQAHGQEPDYKGILQGVLHLVKENEASLPADFVMAVREIAGGSTAPSASDREWSCSICGDSIKSSAHQQIEEHFLAHYSDETNSEHLSAHEQLHESEQERLEAFLPGRNGKAKEGGVCPLPSLWVSALCANGRRKESGTVRADQVQARKFDRRAIHPPVYERPEVFVELSPSCRCRPLQRHAHNDRDVQRRCSFLGSDRKATKV